MFIVWLTTQHSSKIWFFSTIYREMWTRANCKFLIKWRNPRFDGNGNWSSHTLTQWGQSRYWLYLIKVVNVCGSYIISHGKLSNWSSKEHHLLLQSEFYAFRLWKIWSVRNSQIPCFNLSITLILLLCAMTNHIKK